MMYLNGWGYMFSLRRSRVSNHPKAYWVSYTNDTLNRLVVQKL